MVSDARQAAMRAMASSFPRPLGAPPRCPRCQTVLIWGVHESDHAGDPRRGIWQCMLCGEEREPSAASLERKPRTQEDEMVYPEAQSRETLSNPVLPPVPKAADWRELARGQLTALLGKIAKGEAQLTEWRAEAEQCHAALTAIDLPDLPKLPWAQQVSRRGNPKHTCVVCGGSILRGNIGFIRPDGAWQHKNGLSCQRVLNGVE